VSQTTSLDPKIQDADRSDRSTSLGSEWRSNASARVDHERRQRPHFEIPSIPPAGTAI